MLSLSSLGTLILGGGGLITGLLALFSARSNRNKLNSETDINVASVEQSRESLRQARETFWQNELINVRDTFEKEIATLRDEIGWLRVLIENHVPWDWEVVRQLKLAGIEVRDPPTLNYIQSRVQPEES